MTTSDQQAAGSLADIAAVERRTRAALAYGGASAFLILWGVLVVVGAVLNQAFPDRSGAVWYSLDAVGLLGTCAIGLRRSRGRPRVREGWKVLASFLILSAYGIAWSYLLAPSGHERIAVFWATLMMMGVVVAGLWRGPLFAACGLLGTALSFAAFFLAGPWLHLWIGATYGIGFVLGGLWLRQLGPG